jgi:hypothetical protein
VNFTTLPGKRRTSDPVFRLVSLELESLFHRVRDVGTLTVVGVPEFTDAFPVSLFSSAR